VPPTISAPSLNSLALDLLTTLGAALGVAFVGMERVCRLTRGLREAFEDDSLEEDESEEVRVGSEGFRLDFGRARLDVGESGMMSALIFFP